MRRMIAGVPPGTFARVHLLGKPTDLRYNIVTEREAADALLCADAFLST